MTEYKTRAHTPSLAAESTPDDQYDSTPQLLEQWFGSLERPQWLEHSFADTLERAGILESAAGPRELEQASAELIGAQLHDILHDRENSVRLDRWLIEFVEFIAQRAHSQRADKDPTFATTYRLLYGMASISIGEVRATAEACLDELGVQENQPGWLSVTRQPRATGQVWRMTDTYGTRFGVAMECEYPGGLDRHVYLFDIDACIPALLVGADVFDDVESAAATWRKHVPTPTDAQLHLVTDPDELPMLTEATLADFVIGYETRNRLDNYSRADRRINDLADSYAEHDRHLPREGSTFGSIEIDAQVDRFLHWHEQRHEVSASREAVEALAREWPQGILTATRNLISPHRTSYIVASLRDDWAEEDTATAAIALLPEWVRFLGENAGLSPELIDAAVLPATREPDGNLHIACPTPL